MTHFSSLYLFAKETDAIETVKGFKFQELTTLEVWLSNKINGIEEDIYCDFEEDIFQRDLQQYKATFKQLKLYSSKNFSFASIEVTKAIAHFFMLFVKKDYLLDNPTFIFETNTSIAAKKGDNDAELLKKWTEKQDNLDKQLLAECVTKLKSIIDQYINEQYEKLKKEGTIEDLESIKETYEKLPETIWEDFAKSIKWVFSSIEADDAIKAAIDNIMSSIDKLPFPISREEQHIVFDKLRGIVSDRSMATNPEDRKLTNDLMTQALLNLGAKDDKQYNIVYQNWKKVTKINHFTIGEFYEALYAAKHCRRNTYLSGHSTMWLNVLSEYYKHEETPDAQKRESIYELIWLTLRPEGYKKPTNSLNGLEPLVKEYFHNFENYTSSFNIEDCLNLFTIITSSVKFGIIEISEDEIINLYSRFENFLNKIIEEITNEDSLTRILEIKAFFILNFNALGYGEEKKNLEDLTKTFNSILELLPKTHLFSVSQLGERVDAITVLYFNLNAEMEEGDIVSDFSEKLMPFVQSRDQEMNTAKSYIIKGASYLETPGSKGILKALNYFHKAKDLYFTEDSSEGYVLSLINISQFYEAIGMHLAAKHYALGAIWYCSNSQDSNLFKRISDAYEFIVHSEFKQGSWINALQNFETFIAMRMELNPDEFDWETDESLRTTLFEIALIMASVPIIFPPLANHIKKEATKMGDFYTDVIQDFVENIGTALSDKITIQQVIQSKVDNPPVNDIGTVRKISWKIFGSIWSVKFKNDFTTNSIAEEFCSLIQVFLTDIAVNNFDFLFVKSEIEIEIEISDKPKAPVQQASNSKYIWTVYLQETNETDVKKINMHYAVITSSLQLILSKLSLLGIEEFYKQFEALLQKGVTNKALILNAYQKIYRKIFLAQKFADIKRENFQEQNFIMDQREVKALNWKSDTSKLYDGEVALKHVKGRYSNMERKIHLTLARINNEPKFQEKVFHLRSEGWLDWQILMALMNNILNLKANNYFRVKKLNFKTSSERTDAFNKIFQEFINADDEENTYVEIPLDLIISKDLEMHLEQSCTYVLKSFELENRATFVNLSAIRELLNLRFNLNVDDTPDLSPFKF
jgi:hypothetical protein